MCLCRKNGHFRGAYLTSGITCLCSTQKTGCRKYVSRNAYALASVRNTVSAGGVCAERAKIPVWGFLIYVFFGEDVWGQFRPHFAYSRAKIAKNRAVIPRLTFQRQERESARFWRDAYHSMGGKTK